MPFGLSRSLLALIVAAGVFTASPARAEHLARPEGGLHQTTGRCLVGINKEFHTIQSALDVVTCLYVQPDASLWREQLLVRHSLTLAGSKFRHDGSIIRTTLAPPEDATGPVALVRIEGRKIRLKVKHVVFQGPLVSGEGLIGIEAGKDTRLTISDSFFVDIQPETLDTRAGFIAIQVGIPTLPGDTPQITDANISLTRFEGFQNAGIVFQGVGTTGLVDQTSIAAQHGTVSRGAGQAAPAGVVVKNGARATITRNDIIDARGPDGSGGGVGVQVSDAAAGVVVSENNIDRNDTGLSMDGATTATIYRNAFDENGVGIVLGASAPVNDLTMIKNRVEAGGVGVLLLSGTDNFIQSNQILRHTGAGVTLGDAATGNLIKKNRAHGNGGLGFTDATTGLDRSGTANTWRSNLCHGNNGGGAQASPDKLCIIDK